VIAVVVAAVSVAARRGVCSICTARRWSARWPCRLSYSRDPWTRVSYRSTSCPWPPLKAHDRDGSRPLRRHQEGTRVHDRPARTPGKRSGGGRV